MQLDIIRSVLRVRNAALEKRCLLLQIVEVLTQRKSDALNKTVAGVGPVVCREAAWRAFDGEHLPANELTDAQKRSLMAAIDELKVKTGIKKTIRDYGIDETDFLNRLDSMVEQAFDDQCTGANPRYPLMKEIKQMYLSAYYGAGANK